MRPKPDHSPDWLEETLAVRAGAVRSEFGEHSEAIFATSSFVFDSAEQAAARFGGDEAGYIYSRFTNPTVSAFEQRLAELEGGESCIATASGMAAILATVLSLLKSGDRVLACRSLFGSTVTLFQKLLPRFGIETDWIDQMDVQQWSDAIGPDTRMLFLETPTNPLVEIADIKALADLANAHDALLVVDNCFCTPALQKPLAMGADIVIHSATKYIDGQGRCVGGAIVGPGSIIDEEVFAFMRSAGPSMSPFNAWVFHKGLETLNLRMARHCQNAAALADWLVDHKSVSVVNYPGLESHPNYHLAAQQMRQPGGIVSFECAGGQRAAWQLIDSLKLFSITANLGDSRSTITHPASTTHARLTEQERQRSGITPALVRLAPGLEAIDDLISDLATALE